MSAPRPLSSADLAAKLNPVIGHNPAETLHNAACVASFLARFQCDHADGLCLAEQKLNACGPDPLTGNETHGLFFLTRALASALWFEVEGRQAVEGGAAMSQPAPPFAAC